uniref:Uncharacterized protein n=1 Tax=Candidatus Kentrum sp. LPFa TaxID=2126335 RepID=A0A450VQ75_9GAMM|nr:MAG: hypothetical protein BECKLPF1236A_GA0070988_1000528 [Candidatus Kentron sp. LPFa]VFK23088.1 MAG: hypothetical protein BECKLPF1236C_GA0070990_1000326 [Candidatus Kentron sp. LPFa]
MESIVRVGLPSINYGVIIGFEDDSDERLLRLEEAISELHEKLLAINPALDFQILPLSLVPIPDTPQWNTMRDSGLLRIDDPSIFGDMWRPAVDTRHLGYEQIADWQVRLMRIGTPLLSAHPY